MGLYSYRLPSIHSAIDLDSLHNVSIRGGDRVKTAGKAELIIAKQRNGPIGEVPLVFLQEFTRFENRARNGPD